MASRIIYQYSSIARPLDIAYPTNRAVVMLLPLAFLIGAAKGWLYGGDLVQVVMSGARFILICFGAWALARELHPDDNPAAFLAMAFAALVGWFVAEPGLLTLFATLGLVRMVNRTTGLASRKTDSILVLLLVFWVIYATDSPAFGLVAALAYALDGSLNEPARRQWVFALVCLGGCIVYMIDHDTGVRMPDAPRQLFGWLSVLFLLIFALNTWLLKRIKSVGDVGSKSLDLNRVRGGMAVALLAALQGLDYVPDVAVMIATIAGISTDLAFRKGFRVPPGG